MTKDKDKKDILARIATIDPVFTAVKILIAILIALGITLIVLFLVCDTPVEAFITLITVPAQNITFFGRVLKNMVPIVFSGLACALLFRTGLFNLNAEGIYYLGGIVCAELAIRKLGNSFTHPVVIVLVTGFAGAAMMCISGFLKARYDVNELVSSLMLNNIMLYLGLYVLKNTSLRDPTSGMISSQKFADTATLPMLGSLGVTVAFPLALIAVAVVYVILQKTKLGYQIRMSGFNPGFAKYSGMNAFKLFMLVHVMAGFLSGMGTSLEILSNYSRFTWTSLSNLGWDGAMMAMLGGNSPIGVLIASFGMSWLTIGASQLQYAGVDKEIISIVKAILVLLISSRYFLRKWKERALLKEGTSHD